MSEEGGYRGRKRKRKRSSRPSRPALPDNLSGQSSPLPGPSREDVVLSDDEDTTSSKRPRPGTVSSLPRDENNRGSPQPGTSQQVFEPMEVPTVRSDDGYLSDSTPQVSAHQAEHQAEEDPVLAALDALPQDTIDLVALVFALLGILLLNSENNYDFDLLEAALNDTSDPPDAGTELILPQQQLWEIIYNLASNYTDGLSTVLFNPVTMTEDRDCRVCLADYEEGEEITVLPCLHAFHSSCVLHWLQGNPTCPLCRARVE
ncbi:hypothetical protein ACEWY4_010753 [Coilia grayii]|uniref:RING-type domain-containing protein n=1 Tax=Coilia grayii TaxID=363190 RepID=A0ABD1K2T5_9TELE